MTAIETAPRIGRSPVLARVLIVEDDDVNRAFLRGFLVDHGFAVHAVETGEQAVESLRRERFDLVLLDLMLPGMNGGEVAWAAREAGVEVPILAVSAALDVWDPRDLRDLGVSATLPKPFSNDDLLAEVRALVSQPLPAVVDDV